MVEVHDEAILVNAISYYVSVINTCNAWRAYKHARSSVNLRNHMLILSKSDFID